MAVEMHPFCSSSSSAGLWMVPPFDPPLRCLQEKVPALWKDLRRVMGVRRRPRRGSSFGPDERGRGWLRAKQERGEPYILIRRVRVLVAQKEVVDGIGVTGVLGGLAFSEPVEPGLVVDGLRFEAGAALEERDGQDDALHGVFV